MRSILSTLKRPSGSRLFPLLLTMTAITIILIGILSSQPQNAPDLNVRVTEFQPKGEVDLSTNITIRFSKDMVPDDSLDRVELSPPLVITPPLKGIARWIDSDRLRYYPEEKLLPATKYEIAVKSDESFLFGNRINDNRKFIFNTSPLKVLDLEHLRLDEDEFGKETRLQITISFNYKVNQDDLNSKISIKGSENAEKSSLSFEIQKPGEWLSGDYPNQITLLTESFKVTDKRQRYRLRIEKGLKCEECGDIEFAQYENNITVAPRERFFVRGCNAWFEAKQPVISIDLSSPIATDDIDQYISISPEVPFSVEPSYYAIILKGDFKPSETYQVTAARGLPSRFLSKLEDEFSTKVTMPDLPPSLEFVSQAIYLPRNGGRLLELETVNIDELSAEVEQYFENNLVFALASDHSGFYSYYGAGNKMKSYLGRTFFEKNKKLDGIKNQPLTTTVDIGGIIGDTLKGIFKISARNKQQRWNSDSRLIMLTDLGIMARMSSDYLMVWVNTLENVEPVKKAKVILWSKNNQPIAEGKTDSRGICVFNNIHDLTRDFEPYLITASYEGDLSFLKFEECLLPTSDFDIKGRPYLTTGYEACIYLERDIYLPGDTAHIAAIIRGVDGKLPEEFPYFLVINDPRGREFAKLRFTTGGSSFHETEIFLPDFVPTGQYTITAQISEDMEIGRTGFMVEEFMPDRLKVQVKTDKESYSTGDQIAIDVKGEFLFGTPAKGHEVSGKIAIEAKDFTPESWTSYSFIDKSREFARFNAELPGGTLDDSGKINLTYSLPDKMTPPSTLKGFVSASVSEEGGRSITSTEEIKINPYPRYLGLRPEFSGYVKPGENAEAGLIAVDPSGKQISADSIKVRFYRVVYNSIRIKDSDGRYRYVSEKNLVLIDSNMINVPASGTSVSLTPAEYGSYCITAVDLNGGHSSSIEFYASGWGYAPWAMDHPDRIEIDLDRDIYKAKDEAEIQIRAPFGGRLLVTIEKDRVLEVITSEMEDNTARLSIPVKADYFPNAYITATVIRNAGDIDKTTPARAFGMAPLVLKNDDKKLLVQIIAPEIIKPNSNLQVEIQVGHPGLSEITLAAVDAGILQLTAFNAPDPLEFFYGKRMPGLNPYDIYSFIFPEVDKAKSHLSPSGGVFYRLSQNAGFGEGYLGFVQARRVKPVSLWSGIVKTDASGKAKIDFVIPEFNGKLILMAVAAQNTLFGSAAAEMIVRDNIVLQESFPRFTAPSDIVEGMVSVFNHTGKAADMELTLNATGPIELLSPAEQTIHLENNAEGKVIYKFKTSMRAEKIECSITASAEQEKSSINFEFPNRPGQPPKTESGSGVLTENEPLDISLPDKWYGNTDTYIIQTSSLAAVGFTEKINYLVQYPYGCLEQTTSRLFPLLYFNDLARFIDPDLLGSGGPDYYIREGILKLTGMMRSEGGFSFWPGGDIINSWASVYASHFLIEAHRKGYYIDEDIYRSLTENLQNYAQGRGNTDISDPDRIYAAYALAGADLLERKTINYLKGLVYDSLPLYSKFQLAGALALSGDIETARSLLPLQVQPQAYEPETGGRFNSGVRTNAIMLDVFNIIDPQGANAAALAKSLIEDARIGKWYTTQENAFALMALGKYLKSQSKPKFTGNLVFDNSDYSIDIGDFKLIKKSPENKNLKISISGNGKCFYYWQAEGISTETGADEYEHGIKITRKYFDSEGVPVNPESIPLGSQVICHITASAQARDLENVVIVDMLPAGLEIENPRLMTTAKLSWHPKKNTAADYMDIRNDRLLLFVNLNSDKTFEYTYSLRAVSAGEFGLPPIMASCMYNPLIAGASSSGMLKVIR